MRLIRGHKSTTILQKISDDSAAARAGIVRPKSRSILQILARPATKSKGYGRLILRRKVVRKWTCLGEPYLTPNSNGQTAYFPMFSIFFVAVYDLSAGLTDLRVAIRLCDGSGRDEDTHVAPCKRTSSRLLR